MQIRPQGRQGEWVKYNRNLIYKHLFGTHLQLRPVGGLLRLMALTRSCAKVCLLLGFVIAVPHLGGQSLKLQLWDVNRRFQVKRAKY